MITNLLRTVCPAPDGGMPIHFHASRMWTRFWLGFAIGAMALVPLSSAQAGVVGEVAEDFSEKVTDDPTAQKEIGQAVETILRNANDAGEAAKEVGGAPRGPRPSRGISGPFEELVVNFDKLACSAWIISFSSMYRDMAVKRNPETPLEVLNAARILRERVIYACREVMDEETYQIIGQTPPGQGDGQAQTGASGTGDTSVIDGVPIVTAADRACWDRCRGKYAEWQGAKGARESAERRLSRLRDRASDLQSSVIPQLEGIVQRAEADLRALERGPTVRRQGMPDPMTRIARQRSTVNEHRTELARMRAELARTRQEIAALQQYLPSLREQEQAALKAYLDCLKACGDEARLINQISGFVNETIEQLQPRVHAPSTPAPVSQSDTAETRTVRLNAINGLRTGDASRSGTEVMPAMAGFRREGSEQVRADVSERYHEVHRDGYDQDGHENTDYRSEPTEVVEQPGGFTESMSTPVTSASMDVADVPMPASSPAAQSNSSLHYHGAVPCEEQH